VSFCPVETEGKITFFRNYERISVSYRRLHLGVWGSVGVR